MVELLSFLLRGFVGKNLQFLGACEEAIADWPSRGLLAQLSMMHRGLDSWHLGIAARISHSNVVPSTFLIACSLPILFCCQYLCACEAYPVLCAHSSSHVSIIREVLRFAATCLVHPLCVCGLLFIYGYSCMPPLNLQLIGIFIHSSTRASSFLRMLSFLEDQC